MDDAAIMRWRDKVDLAINKFAYEYSREDKRDLRQDCYLAIAKAESRINHALARGDDARALVYTIAKQEIIKQITKPSHQLNRKLLSLEDEAVRSEIETGNDPSRDPAEQSECSADIAAMGEAIEKLPAMDQYLVKSVFLGGRSKESLAEELSRSRFWVRKTVELALQKLRVIMETK